jgi:hypothetical protein
MKKGRHDGLYLFGWHKADVSSGIKRNATLSTRNLTQTVIQINGSRRFPLQGL